MIILDIAEGWTDMLGPFQLRANGVPFSLAGLEVNLILRDGFGRLVQPAGTITLADQNVNPGQVFFTPAKKDFEPGPKAYTIRWEVIDGEGGVVYFPNGRADEIRVFPK